MKANGYGGIMSKKKIKDLSDELGISEPIYDVVLPKKSDRTDAVTSATMEHYEKFGLKDPCIDRIRALANRYNDDIRTLEREKTDQETINKIAIAAKSHLSKVYDAAVEDALEAAKQMQIKKADAYYAEQRRPENSMARSNAIKESELKYQTLDKDDLQKEVNNFITQDPRGLVYKSYEVDQFVKELSNRKLITEKKLVVEKIKKYDLRNESLSHTPEGFFLRSQQMKYETWKPGTDIGVFQDKDGKQVGFSVSGLIDYET